jgi:hypothetical protein
MRRARHAAIAAIGVVAVVAGLGIGQSSAASASSLSRSDAVAKPALTNLAHLDFLLDTITPAAASGHTTYRLGSENTLTMPWVYANANSDGSFTRVGGGDYDAATGHYGQGSFDTDDIARAAVVYLRDWKQTGSASSRDKAYELLRSTAFFQTTSGPEAGNVVLWMQPDGTLNPTPTPADTPNPSDNGASYWLARSLWAFGEGYADFRHSDPKFAAFLKARIDLGIAALDREVLDKYGKFAVTDGVRVPSWLIVDGADASSEAVLGLAAYTAVEPGDRAARAATVELSKGIAMLSSGSPTQWPYGAILPSADSRSMWHAYLSQMPEALAEASTVLHDRSLLTPAIADSTSFTTTLLTADGPDNAWYPAPVDQTQIAYGADSRLQSLLAVSAAARSSGIRQLAGIEAAWYFGMNKAGVAVYNPATGVTTDGIAPDGTVSKNSGAESTIHGLLSMLALDANPDVARLAQSAAQVSSRDGLTVSEGESATSTDGTVITPAAAYTGESQYSGGKYLQLTAGQSATIALAPVSGSFSGDSRSVEPVVLEPTGTVVTSSWAAGAHSLGTLRSGVGAQGVSAIPGALLPQTLPGQTSAKSVTVTVLKGTLDLDAVLSRPAVERLGLTGPGGATTTLLHSTVTHFGMASVGRPGVRTTVRVYDVRGRLVSSRTASGIQSVRLSAGGFAVATS